MAIYMVDNDLYCTSELMIMASHQTFPADFGIWLSKYIINKETNVQTNFNPYLKLAVCT